MGLCGQEGRRERNGEKEHESVCVGMAKGNLPEAQKSYPKCSAYLPHVQCDQGPRGNTQETQEGHTFIKLVLLDQLVLSLRNIQELSTGKGRHSPVATQTQGHCS